MSFVGATVRIVQKAWCSKGFCAFMVGGDLSWSAAQTRFLGYFLEMRVTNPGIGPCLEPADRRKRAPQYAPQAERWRATG